MKGAVDKRLTEFLARHMASIMDEDIVYSKLVSELRRLIGKYKSKSENVLKEKISMCEDVSVSPSIREKVEKLIKECEDSLSSKWGEYRDWLKSLSSIYNSRVNESIRLGIYRTLFIESYNRVYGIRKKTTLDVYTYHGVFKEYLKIVDRGKTRRKHTGLDLVFFISIPHNNNRRLILPLLIIGKYDEKEARKVELIDAVNYALHDLDKGTKEYIALQFVPKFARIALLRVKDPLERRKVEECVVNKNSMIITTYDDFICSILYPLFIDIPRLYNNLVSDEKFRKLTTLTIEDWMRAILKLSSVIIIVPTIIESKRPPINPAGDSVLLETMKILKTKIQEQWMRTNSIIHAIIQFYKYEIEKLYSEYINDLDRVLEESMSKIDNIKRKLWIKIAI